MVTVKILYSCFYVNVNFADSCFILECAVVTTNEVFMFRYSGNLLLSGKQLKPVYALAFPVCQLGTTLTAYELYVNSSKNWPAKVYVQC